MEDNHINEEDAVLEEGIVQIEEETVTEEVRETAGEDATRQPLVYPLMFLVFAGAMWLIFAPSSGGEEK